MNGFLEAIAINSLVAAVLSVVVFCVTRFIHRAPIVYALWTLVLLKLLVPPLFYFPVDLPGDWISLTRFDHVAAPIVSSAMPEPVLAGGFSSIDDATLVDNATELEEIVDANDTAATTNLLSSADFDLQSSFLEAATESRFPTFSISQALIGIWVLGAVLWAGNALRHVLRFRRLLRQTRPAQAALQSEVARLAQNFGLRRCPKLRVVDGCVPPLVWPAWGGPIVLLPAELMHQLDSTKQLTLIAHELAHIRRRDHWWRWLHLAAIGGYWWHPVAWWAVRRIQQAEEQCCDAWVVWMLADSGHDYAQTLLNTIDFLSPAQFSLPPQASGLGKFSPFRRRIEMLVQGRLTRQMSRRCLAAVFLCGAALLIFSAQARPAASTVDAEPKSKSTNDSKPDAAKTVQPENPKPTDNPDVHKRLNELEQKVQRLERELSAAQSKPSASASTPIGLPGPAVLPLKSHGTRSDSANSDHVHIRINVQLTGPKGSIFYSKMRGESRFTQTTKLQSDFQYKKGSDPPPRQIGELKLTGYPGYEQTELFGQILVMPPTSATAFYLNYRNIPLEISSEEFERALNEGMLLKAVYLPKSKGDTDDPFRVKSLSGYVKDEIPDHLQKASQLGELLCFVRLGRMAVTYVGGRDKMTNPPSPEEVMESVPKQTGGGLSFVATHRRDEVRITIEQIVDQIEHERHYPLVGAASLQKAHFKCEARFREFIQSEWPIPFKHDAGPQVEVVYIDHDHLIKSPGAETGKDNSGDNKSSTQ